MESFNTHRTEEKYIYMIVFGTPQGKRQLRKARPRWKYNSKVYLKEVAGNGAV